MRVACGALLLGLMLLAPTARSQPPNGKHKDNPDDPSSVGGKTLKEWRDELTSKDASRRAIAIMAIAQFGNSAARAVPDLIARLEDSDVSPRTKAMVALRADPEAVAEAAVWVYPLSGRSERFDALAQRRYTHDAIVMRLPLDQSALPAVLRNFGLLAMQEPGLTDWRLSPASFAGNPGVLVGHRPTRAELPPSARSRPCSRRRGRGARSPGRGSGSPCRAG